MIAYCEASGYNQLFQYSYDIFDQGKKIKQFISKKMTGGSCTGEIMAVLTAYISEFKLHKIYTDNCQNLLIGLSDFDRPSHVADLAKHLGLTKTDFKELSSLLEPIPKFGQHKERHSSIHNRLNNLKYNNDHDVILIKKEKKKDKRCVDFLEFLKTKLPRIMAKNRDKSGNRAIFLIRQEFETLFNV